MSNQPVSIPKKPALRPAQDYYRLRREGIGFIEQMGSRNWTDYNAHDPGITILEALCYALTDLGYRLGWDIKDLLAPPVPGVPTHQPFFTARDILTVNPWTPDDFRRLLIDLDGVRNAWVFCKECACDLRIYATCSEEEELVLSYQKPQLLKPHNLVEPRGLYEVLLELERDAALGDLNDRKIELEDTFLDADGERHSISLELRFPEPGVIDADLFSQFLNNANNINAVHLLGLCRSKTTGAGFPVDRNEFRRNWQGVFYLKLKVEFTDEFTDREIEFDNVSLRIFGNDDAKNALLQQTPQPGDTPAPPQGLVDILEKTTGLADLYRRKWQLAEEQVQAAKATLHAHRNLDEDFCHIDRVSVEDVAVCADVEVAADADIERVQAQIWFEIEQYFNPPIYFYALHELQERGIPTEEIFNGPELNNGFLLAEEVEAAQLRTLLRSSDIINRIADIEGVVAVNNLLLTKYDAEGNPITGDADKTPTHNPNKMSAQWTLEVTSRHQPRLYQRMSRFLFYKNGLPFVPRMDEARDTLLQLQGETERPKIKGAVNDLPVPAGTFRQPEAYFPVQYSFPLSYGIGHEGLPGHAGPQRRGQAKQLKAYLLCFEQLLVNTLAQIAHTADLFALDPTVQRTYFTRLIGEDLIRGADELFNGLDQERLDAMVETEPEFLDRRNRFLDHLMARFGEQFGEYALLLYNTEGRKLAQERLVLDKIAFLNAYPLISHDRARAFNYRLNPTASGNLPGLQVRVSKLLGYSETHFSTSFTTSPPGNFLLHFSILDYDGNIWLHGYLFGTAPTEQEAERQTFEAVTAQMFQPGSYSVVDIAGQYRIDVDLPGGQAQHPTLYTTEAEARARIADLMVRVPRSFSGNERFILVEHLLLRPKFPGDALYPACSDHGCAACGDEDPYSFRLTFVMPGWADPYNNNLELRGFAERTIRQETPAHLLPKVCWVGNDGLAPDPCHPVVGSIADALTDDETPDCGCAQEIFEAFSQKFVSWFDGKKMEHHREAVWREQLEPVFAGIDPTEFTCPVSAKAWTTISGLLLDHFTQIALNGWQFGKFEHAWTQWLEANAAQDWTELRLQERVEAILDNWALSLATPPKPAALCSWAADFLGAYGMTYYDWMKTFIADGNTAVEAVDAAVPVPIIPRFNAEFDFPLEIRTELNDLIIKQYSDFNAVSYWLWIVLDLLGKLRNSYPAATLHDCDDGSDVNPVRLNQTALGGH